LTTSSYFNDVSGSVPIWPRLNFFCLAEDVLSLGISDNQLSPAWRMLVLGDGSPTRHLQFLTSQAISVDVIDMSMITQDENNLPPEEIEDIANPQILRQVWLKSESGERLAYAASWWSSEKVNQYLENRSIPIWDSLSLMHTELYRDIRSIYCGHSDFLEEQFAHKGPFWGRHYLFWHHQKPITLIYEVFSPVLKKYLGEISI